jgi:hypothetical protein
MHLRLQGVFERLGRKDLAKQEADWMDRFMKAQKEQGGMPGFLGGGSFTVK